MTARATKSGEVAAGWGYQAYRTLLMKTLQHSLYGTVVSLILVVICTYLYARWKVDPAELNEVDTMRANEELNNGKWRYGLFQCFQDPKMLCFACFCPAIRWGDTMRMAGLIGFWSAVSMFAICYYLAGVTLGITLVFILALTTMRRQELRTMFGLPAGGFKSHAEDCFTYMCCMWCAIVQEARQLDEAYAARHDILHKIPHLVLRAQT